MQPVLFKSIGIARVMSNKPIHNEDTNTPGMFNKNITVMMLDTSYMRDGEILPATADLKFDVTDVDGVSRKGKISVGNDFEATWLPMKSHHLAPPSVRRGERVEIFQVADQDKYYWRELGIDDHLRKLDTIIIALSNTQDEEVTELTADNTYWIEFSTQSKKLAIVTSQSDGEPFGYEFFLDTKEGVFRGIDTQNTFLEMVSAQRLIQMMTADKAFSKVEKNTVHLATPEGAEYHINGENITSRNAAGSLFSMIDGEIKMVSSGGGSLVINENVVAKSSSGDTLDLSNGTSKLAAGTGGAITITGGTVGGP